MAKYNTLFFKRSEAFHSEIGRVFKFLPNFTLAGIAESMSEAMVLLERMNVQLLIVELTHPALEAYELIERASLSKPAPYIIGVVPTGTPALGDRAKAFGADAAYTGQFKLEEILASFVNRDNAGSISINIKTSDKALDERLSNIFIASGIPPHVMGYQYLREAVKQAVKQPEMINNITKMLYPAVAEKFNTSSSKVERAIRHAIDVAWNRGKIDNINSIYGIKVFSKSDKPTNGELIALVSDRMIIEGA